MAGAPLKSKGFTYVRTRARVAWGGGRRTCGRTYARTRVCVARGRHLSLDRARARTYVQRARKRIRTCVRAYEQPTGRGMRNRISWLIACQSVCAGTDGIRKGWGGNHEAPSPFALGGVALGPKGIACVHTYAHIRREAESDGGTRVRMRKCARTYVLRGRLLSLSAVRAHTMHVRTYRRACVRATGAGTCAGTHAPYVRTQGEHGKHVRRHAARPHAQTHATTPGREEEGAIPRQRPKPPLPSAAARPST